MYKIFKMATLFVFIMICLIPVAQAEELMIGLGNFEPHFIKEGDTGLFTDLVKETFAILPQYAEVLAWDVREKEACQRIEKWEN